MATRQRVLATGDRAGFSLRRRCRHAAAAALFDLLVSSEENKATLAKVFRRLSQGVTPGRVLEPKEIRELEPLWLEHWQRLRDS